MGNEAPSSSAGFVLAGGRSSRMGADKALAIFAGRPLIQVAMEKLSEAGIPARIAGSRSDLSAFGETVPDSFPDSGPLGGVCSALAASAAEWSLFLPVDLPLMPAGILATLLQRAEIKGAAVTALRLDGRLEPFPVVLHRLALPSIERRIRSGDTACHKAWQSIPDELHSVLDAVPVEDLIPSGQIAHRNRLPVTLWFESANTPEDLARLNLVQEALLGGIDISTARNPVRLG